jgi:SAM-dependent methyltransferase
MDGGVDSGRAGVVVNFVRSRPRLKRYLRTPLERFGFGTADWVREVMYKECFEYLRSIGPENLDALEISAGSQWRGAIPFRTFSETQYPDFDICQEKLSRSFDVIIADQVFEHLPWPYRAVKNVHAMLRPGGVFIVATPFLVRVHAVPVDCSRWTETGLSYLLQEGGFPAERIVTRSWGNRACVVSNFCRWSKRGFFGSLANEPNFPVMVWAYAHRALQGRNDGG